MAGRPVVLGAAGCEPGGGNADEDGRAGLGDERECEPFFQRLEEELRVARVAVVVVELHVQVVEVVPSLL